ncbi:MAG: ABC transporter substrate-binding protein [Actinomycetota bacterium]
MLSTKDRILAGLFALQLLASLAMGVGLIRGLNREGIPGTLASAQTRVAPGASALAAAPTEPAAAAAETPGAVTRPGSRSGGSQNEQSSAEVQGITKDSVKVGVLVTQRGAINFAGAAQGAKAYFDYVNEHGGVNGRRIVAIYADDELDSAKGLAAIAKMINDDKVFAFAAWNAPLTEQYSTSVVNENRIPLVGCYGMWDEYRSPYTYTFEPFYYRWATAMSSYAVDHGAKKPAAIYIDNGETESNAGFEAGLKDGFARRGVRLDPGQIYKVDVTNPDYTQQVASMQGGGVDSLVTFIDQTAYVRLQIAMNRQRFKPIHVADPMVLDSMVVGDRNVGESFDGTYVASEVEYLTSSSPQVSLYIQEVKRRFGSKAILNWSGEIGWADARIFVEALRRSGPNPTRQGLLAAMDSFTDYDAGIIHPFTLRPGPHDPNRCFKSARIAGGKPEVLTDWLCV